MIAMHLGGIPETAMVLGPILLIVAFVRIARRNEANRPSRNCTGMSRARARSPIGTGPASPRRASSESARTAYGDLLVITSTR